MDLGYGSKNQEIGQAATLAIIQSTKAKEEAINLEIDRYDVLLSSTDCELEKIRERRLAQLKKNHERKQSWLANDHGIYSAIGQGQHGQDAAKEFFDATKKSERLVIHFHRPTSRVCDIFHGMLNQLAIKHVETRFLKVDVDPVASDGAHGSGTAYLVEKLGIVVMPTLVIVKDRKAVHHIRGFDELGGTEEFSIDALEWILGMHGAIFQSDDKKMPQDLMDKSSKEMNGLKIRTKCRGKRGGVRDGDNVEDDSD